MLTQERLKELYTFDQDTGHFRYLSKSRTRRRGVGAVAGSLSKQMGYVLVGVDGPQYLAHRLAWLYMTGAWPDAEVDHIDGDHTNNDSGNLQELCMICHKIKGKMFGDFDKTRSKKSNSNKKSNFLYTKSAKQAFDRLFEL